MELAESLILIKAEMLIESISAVKNSYFHRPEYLTLVILNTLHEVNMYQVANGIR